MQGTKKENQTLFDKKKRINFNEREIRFHEENLKQPIDKQIPEDKYRYIIDENNNKVDKLIEVNKKIADFKKEGIKLSKVQLTNADKIKTI